MERDSFVIMKAGRLNTEPGTYAKVSSSAAPAHKPRLAPVP